MNEEAGFVGGLVPTGGQLPALGTKNGVEMDETPAPPPVARR
jgi:hypothetical protein